MGKAISKAVSIGERLGDARHRGYRDSSSTPAARPPSPHLLRRRPSTPALFLHPRCPPERVTPPPPIRLDVSRPPALPFLHSMSRYLDWEEGDWAHRPPAALSRCSAAFLRARGSRGWAVSRTHTSCLPPPAPLVPPSDRPMVWSSPLSPRELSDGDGCSSEKLSEYSSSSGMTWLTGGTSSCTCCASSASSANARSGAR